MNLDAYRIAWRSGDGTSYAALREELENLIKALTRSERRSRTVSRVCMINTAIVLLLAIGILVFRRPLIWSEVAPILGLQIILACVLASLVRRRRQTRQALESSITSIREATQVGLDNVNREIRDARVLLSVACIALPLFGVAVNQLMSSGKMNTQAATSFGMLLAAVIARNGVVLWRKHCRILIPRRRRLEQILASLQETDA
jgi:hypothetical protein